MYSKKKLALLIIICLFAFPSKFAWGTTPNLHGEAGILLDASNGQVLYGKNIDQQLYPASTTKILTCIIALEKAQLDEIVTVSKNAVATGGSAIGLQEGEKIAMESLLYATLLNSANDAAEAIAEHIGGSVPGFAQIMNDKARELGALNSNFVNPHGLPDPAHVTTAEDLAIITRYAMSNKKFREIVSTRHKEISRGIPEEEKPQTWMYNHNRLIIDYEGATGVKTGYTNAARFCLVGSAKRGDRELIAVAMKSESSPQVNHDVASLLDYGFSQFERRLVVEKDKFITRLEVLHGTREVLVKTGESFSYNFPLGNNGEVSERVVLIPGLEAPVNRGDLVANLVVYFQGEQVGEVKLLALDDVPRKITHNWWFWPTIAVSGLLLVRTWIGSRRKRRRNIFRNNCRWR